ncbi:MAG: hypothetical protein V4772_18395 [Pseudomonadota bacterium]
MESSDLEPETHGTKGFGFASFICGLAACIVFYALAYLAWLGPLPGGKVLSFFDYLGLVSHERTYLAELKPGSAFAFNDASVILFLKWLAFDMVILATTLALYAEYSREPTLYLSAGFILGTLSLVFVYPLATVAVQVAWGLGFVCHSAVWWCSCMTKPRISKRWSSCRL